MTLKNSSHLEWRVGLSDTILKGTHPRTIYARFGPYIDASCQVWFHLAKLFQGRRLKYDEKRTKTPRLYFKIAGHVDLDKLHMFSVYTYLL